MSSERRIAAVLLAAGLGLLAAAFFFLGTSMPSDDLAYSAPEPGGVVAIPKKKKRRWQGGGRAKAKAGKAEVIRMPDEGVAPRTDSCRYIVKEQRRGVHAFILLDNIRDQGMRFSEDDVACLAASGVEEVIVNYAEFDLTARTVKEEEGQRVGVQ